MRRREVTFKVVDGTEPTVSMPMLVASGHRLVKRGDDTMLSTAAGEVVPLTSDGDDWYLKVLINSENVFIRIDVWPHVTNARRVGFDTWKGEPRDLYRAGIPVEERMTLPPTERLAKATVSQNVKDQQR